MGAQRGRRLNVGRLNNAANTKQWLLLFGRRRRRRRVMFQLSSLALVAEVCRASASRCSAESRTGMQFCPQMKDFPLSFPIRR